MDAVVTAISKILQLSEAIFHIFLNFIVPSAGHVFQLSKIWIKMIFQRFKLTASGSFQPVHIFLRASFKLSKGRLLLFQSKIHSLIIKTAISVFQLSHASLVCFSQVFCQLVIMLSQGLHLPNNFFCLCCFFIKIGSCQGQAVFYSALEISHIICNGGLNIL